MSKEKMIIICIILIILILIIIPIIVYEYNIHKKNNDKILFLGDSITERYNFKKYFPNHKIINSGVGGNLTTDILNDLENRVFIYKPDKVFILVGINDIIYTDLTNKEIVSNIELIAKKIKKELPNTKIYIESIYPVNYRYINKIYKDEILNKNHNKRIKEINKLIKKMCKNNNYRYINIYSSLNILFQDKLFRYFTTDGLHINRLGYRLITFKLLKYINE